MNKSKLLEIYRDTEIAFQSNDAFVNATDMAAAFGKRPNDFLALPSAKAYLSALTADLNQLPENLVIKNAGRHSGGTWMHPDLAMEFARWLSPEFSIWCNRVIRRILAGQSAAPAADTGALTAALTTW